MINSKLVLFAVSLAISLGWVLPVSAEPTETVLVPMRDGARLVTDLYLPSGDGPWPAVVTRTPYDRTRWAEGSAKAFVDRDYAYVVQSVRGIHGSEGDYLPFENDMEDGYDAVEWIAAQSWSNGKVGITGPSAMGITGNLAAAADPPHLVAAFVVVAPQALFSESRFIGGVFKESHAGGWLRRQGAGDQIPAFKKRVVMDDHWRATDFIHHRHEVDIPIYNVGGWYDIFVNGNIENFRYLQNNGLPGARGNQKLLMGPFGHGVIAGDLAYPDSGSLAGFANVELRWFDYWLKGIDNGIMEEPPVRYYMMASARAGKASPLNRWINAASWPPESTPTRFYLQPDGGLSTQAPSRDVTHIAYRFDPEDPVPTVGGLNLMLPKGPMDQREIGQREDYLRFETGVLTEPVTIAGKVDVELWAATDGLDTDFMVKLVDVYPDGYEALVTDNPIRTRYRKGRNPEDVELMTPGVPAKLTVDLWHSAITFEKGHKIAVHVTSSNFPRFEVNPNTGDPPGEPTTPRVATNTVFFEPGQASAIILPVVTEARPETD